MVKLYDIVATAGEVDALIETAGEERDYNDYDECQSYHERYLATAEEVEVYILKFAAREGSGEGKVKERLGLAECHEYQSGKEHCCEERADDTDDKCGGESLDRTCAVEEQDYCGDNRGKVGVEDGGECVGITVGDSLMDVLAGAELFLGTLEYKHVGVNGHTKGEHDTGDAGECKHCLERGEDAECEEEVADKADVGD